MAGEDRSYATVPVQLPAPLVGHAVWRVETRVWRAWSHLEREAGDRRDARTTRVATPPLRARYAEPRPTVQHRRRGVPTVCPRAACLAGVRHVAMRVGGAVALRGLR